MTFPTQKAILFPEKKAAQNTPQRVLFVGEKLAIGTATEGDLFENIVVSQAKILYGERSMLAEMVRRFRGVNTLTRLDTIGVDEPAAGVTPVYKIDFTFVGALTSGAIFRIIIGSKKHVVEIQASAGDTATVVRDAMTTAIPLQLGSDAPIDPTTVITDLTTALNFSFVSKGTTGNDLPIRAETNTRGVGIEASLKTPGTLVQSLTTILDAVQNERYQTIVAPQEYGEAFLTAFLNPKFNPPSGIQDGVGLMTFIDTFSNILTRNTSNSESLNLIGITTICDLEAGKVNIGGVVLDESWSISAHIAADRSLRLTDGASLSGIINAVGPDLIGGRRIASLPYANTLLTGLGTIPARCKLTQEELKQINDSGVSTLFNNKMDDTLVMGEFVTTRLTDAGGDPEITFHFLNAVDTGSAIREDILNNFKKEFSQHRLTPGGLVGGGNIVNNEVLRAFFMGRYRILGGENLTVAGPVAETFVDTNLKVTLDFETGKVTFEAPLPIVTQLREAIYNLRIQTSGI